MYVGMRTFEHFIYHSPHGLEGFPFWLCSFTFQTLSSCTWQRNVDLRLTHTKFAGDPHRTDNATLSSGPPDNLQSRLPTRLLCGCLFLRLWQEECTNAYFQSAFTGAQMIDCYPSNAAQKSRPKKLGHTRARTHTHTPTTHTHIDRHTHTHTRTHTHTHTCTHHTRPHTHILF